MENSKAVLTRRSREGGKGAATAMDMVQERINKDTRDTEAVIFVQDEIDTKVNNERGYDVMRKPVIGLSRPNPGTPAPWAVPCVR